MSRDLKFYLLVFLSHTQAILRATGKGFGEPVFFSTTSAHSRTSRNLFFILHLTEAATGGVL